MADLIEAVKDELSGEPSPARAIKLLDTAAELGWTENPAASFVIRLTHPEGRPFFARWDLSVQESGKRSWRFQGARANNGQPLNYNDVKLYLQDPTVIEPDPPTSPEDDTDEAVRTALGSLDPLGPTAVPPGREPVKAAAPAAADWGALLG